MNTKEREGPVVEFLTEEEYRSMQETFREIAESPRAGFAISNRKFDRQRVAEAFQSAFETVGGVQRLTIYAHNNYDEFIKLYAKLMPKDSDTLGDAMKEMVIKQVLKRSKLDEAPEPKKISSG